MTEHRSTYRVHLPSGEEFRLRRVASGSECVLHFPCELNIIRGRLQANAKSDPDFLCLGATRGEELLLEADGPESPHSLESASTLMT